MGSCSLGLYVPPADLHAHVPPLPVCASSACACLLGLFVPAADLYAHVQCPVFGEGHGRAGGAKPVSGGQITDTLSPCSTHSLGVGAKGLRLKV